MTGKAGSSTGSKRKTQSKQSGDRKSTLEEKTDQFLLTPLKIVPNILKGSLVSGFQEEPILDPQM